MEQTNRKIAAHKYFTKCLCACNLTAVLRMCAVQVLCSWAVSTVYTRIWCNLYIYVRRI